MRVLLRLWRRLISMRTALILLFLLALAAVPGSLLPQRPLNPSKVDAYLATHGAWGRFLDRIGGFDVFGSIWFSAVYLLLFVSLIGCLIPRITVYAKALRAKPIKAPRHLHRLAENAELGTVSDAAAAAARTSKALRPRWRTTTRTEESGAIAVSAEKGDTREAGNLVFHVSLLVALVLIAGGKLLSYQGSIISTEGTSFCNRPIVYDAFHAGRWVNAGKIAGFCAQLNTFTATYRADGSPQQFKADVTYTESLNGADRHDVITVNHPLRTDGDRIYLINHGFSPTVTITRPGRAAVTDTEAFLPEDEVLTSEGAFSFTGKANLTGDDIGLSAIFAPSPQINGGVVTSTAPSVDNPVLAVLAYKGTLNPTNAPHSVYSLDQDQIANGGLKQVGAKNLRVGQSMTLNDGTVVRFDGYKQWVTLQVSHDPTQALLLIAAVLMVLGLLGSLAVRRRRLWIRFVPQPDGRTLVSAGGLARSDTGNFTAEFESIVLRLREALGTDVELERLADKIGAGKD